LDGFTWRTLPGTEGAIQPFWAGDSSAIGFFSLGRLRAMSIDGSDLRNLGAAPDPAGGDWRGGPAGTILFASGGSVHALDLSSGKRSVVASGQPVSDPAFVPEGDGFVYLAGPQPNGRLLRASLATDNHSPQLLLNTNWQVSFARHPHTGRWHIFYIGSRPVDSLRAADSSDCVMSIRLHGVRRVFHALQAGLGDRCLLSQRF
jgi:hypothetical protein